MSVLSHLEFPVPKGRSLPTLSEMQAHTNRIRVEHADCVEITLLGHSRAGRPLEMISIGQGERSALIVGAPHPNEPIGCAVVEHMIDSLISSQALRERSGFQWHFIKAIDPDGVALNEGWMKTPRRPEDYYPCFFRPASAWQPEYCFPLSTPDYSFGRPIPETQSWLSAIERVRPNLHSSLHHCEFGGVFFIASTALEACAEDFSKLTQEAGLTLDDIGEPGLPHLAPGLFGFVPVQVMIADEVAKNGRAAWDCGDSSTGYTERRFGTLNVTCEVPIWDDASLRDTSRSSQTVGEVMDTGGALVESALQDAGYFASILRPFVRTPEQEMVASALEAFLKWGKGRSVEAFENLEPDAHPRVCDVAIRLTKLRLWTLRIYALQGQLAASLLRDHESTVATEALAAAHKAIRDGVARLSEEANLMPIPLDTLIKLQMDTVLVAAGVLQQQAAS